MIVTSRVTNELALSVFENFRSDQKLPKFRKSSIKSSIGQFGFTDSELSNDVSPMGDNQFSPSWIVGSQTQSFELEVATYANGSSLNRRQKFALKVGRLMERVLRISPTRPVVKPRNENFGNGNPLEILLSVSNCCQDLQDYLDRVKTYDSAIKDAVAGGQTARAKKLMKARSVVQAESALLVAKFNKFLSEALAIEFAKKCQKGLRLDWVENFGRPIPKEVLERKLTADSLNIFDNYVVLHYDPNGKAFELTPEQIAAKKDPILFGVIEGVRKLYYIGDWMDDVCDLTMDEVSKTLGHDTGTIEVDPTIGMEDEA